MRVDLATAPVSWGILIKGMENVPPYPQVLDEMREAGYTGTELGAYGYLPLDPELLRSELRRRNLHLLSSFVPVTLVDPQSRPTQYEEAITTARFLAEMGCEWIVLSDALFVDEVRSRRAGRIRPEDGLDESGWQSVIHHTNAFGRRMRDEFGLKTVVHPHVGTFIEAPWEVDRLLSSTDPELVGLCLDTGHAIYGGDDPVALLERWAPRVRYLHLKDCDKTVLERIRASEGDYFAGVRSGVFPELGKGSVDFPGFLAGLRQHNFEGWAVVEQDILHGSGMNPLNSAKHNLHYLKSIGF
ncbi:MAG TPA: sugar phosphate isomerase/epimerase [Chloroflexota bacterium]|nr:sugar phosphate isomerase/epimerase [Chloroflexota bacterium]